MSKYGDVLIKKFLEEHSFVGSDITSFNNFIEIELQNIIDENKTIEPTIVPPNVEDYQIKLDKITIKMPEITEADGSRRLIYPAEARLRKISYAAPIFIELSAHINGVQRETITPQVGSLPIMLRSKYCHLNGMSREELIAKGEDPDDPGGYFIINGTERVLVHVEDLAANRMIVEHTPKTPSEYTGKIFSEHGSYKIPHVLEKLKDGIFYLSFTRAKRVPIIWVIKALGLLKDEEIMSFVSRDKQYDELLVNLLDAVKIKTEEDAIDEIAKAMGITQTKEIRLERAQEVVDRFLLPHIGTTRDSRQYKAYNLCKMLKKFLQSMTGEIPLEDKDHYANKRLKMSGDLLADLFRVNLKVMIGDMLYNFQRIVKRGKFPSIKTIVRDNLLTSRIYSSMATGNWVGSRKGISQRIQRLNHLNTLSHLQRVSSPLSASQENFKARELHATHLGRLCPAETPEGTNIGLKKNLAMLASISGKSDEEEIVNALKAAGLKEVI